MVWLCSSGDVILLGSFGSAQLGSKGGVKVIWNLMSQNIIGGVKMVWS